MIIVRIQGGLANQMFQYTFYYWLTQRHDEYNLNIDTFCDTSMYYHKIPKQECDPFHNGYELETVFGIKANIAELKDVYRLSEFRYDLVRKAIIKSKLKFTGTIRTQISDNGKELYNPKFAYEDEKYFTGTWGGFRYAEDYKDEIRQIFKFPEISDDLNRRTADNIKAANSVSVHVRRGDYLSVGNGVALARDYWDNAILKIREQVENPVFYFFSDDIQWCKNNFQGEDIRFVDWNVGKNSYRDMQLMSLCKHNIVANSTFSMWASWLNVNEDKIVIRPGQSGGLIVEG